MRNAVSGIGIRAVCIASLLLLSGCLSDNPGSGSLAYVDIESYGSDAVRAETIRVFQDDHYALASETAGAMVFEREATQRDRVLWGQYGDAHLAMEVVVSIEPRRQGGVLLRADAFVLRDGSRDKVPRMARRPYQDLLKQVKASLVAVE